MTQFIKGKIKGKCKLPTFGKVDSKDDLKYRLRAIGIMEAYLSDTEEIGGYQVKDIANEESFETEQILNAQIKWKNNRSDSLHHLRRVIIQDFKIKNVVSSYVTDDQYADFEGTVFATIGQEVNEQSEVPVNEGNKPSLRVSAGQTPHPHSAHTAGTVNAWGKRIQGLLLGLLLLWFLPNACTNWLLPKRPSLPCVSDTVMVQKTDTVFIEEPSLTVTNDSTEIVVNTASVTLTVGDHSVTDNDTISISLNGELISDHLVLNREEPSMFTIELNEGTNELKIHTHSIGTEGDFASPLIIINAGSRRYVKEPKCRPEEPFVYHFDYYR
ncbi:MAG: hypothetical protein U0X91_27750 [Spirosomataceae bacterium]